MSVCLLVAVRRLNYGWTFSSVINGAGITFGTVFLGAVLLQMSSEVNEDNGTEKR